MERTSGFVVLHLLLGLLAASTSSCLPDLLSLWTRKAGGVDPESPVPDGYLERFYLDMPRKRSEFKGPFQQHVHEALIKLPFKPPADRNAALPSPHEVLATIRETKREERNSAHRVIYEQLAKLADQELNDCSTYMIDVIKSVWAQQRAEYIPARLAALLKGYLQHFGASAMEFCIDQINMEELDKNNEAERAFSEFYAAAKSVDVHDERTLFTVINRMNLYKDSLNVDPMAEVAKKWMEAKLPPNKRQPLSMMRALLNEKCLMLAQESGTVADMVNLARLLGSKRKYADDRLRLLKLNELNRLCLSWRKDPSYIITDRLHVQLDNIGGVLRPPPSDGQE